MADRDFDIVLFGATGFTGALTAEYLARNAPAGLRWALAGRNPEKLAKVRADLAAIDPALADLELLAADVTDAASLADVAARARVVITTVGPYLTYGEPLVAACAEAGTDYVDLTGEPEFVDRMYVAHHETAQRTGARIVHACGFDSIPHDLGAYFTVQQLPSDQPITMRGVVRASGMFSGGTFHSAMTAMSRGPPDEGGVVGPPSRRAPRPRDARRAPSPASPTATGCSATGCSRCPPSTRPSSPAAAPHCRRTARSSATPTTPAPRPCAYAAGGAAGVTALGVSAQVKPLRNLLLSRIKQGDGPDEAKREKSWFRVEFVGEAANGVTVRTRVSGGDPGYGETAKMLAESALCLALDDNPELAGQLTTAQAMGDNLIARLQKAGITFETVG